MPEEIILVNSSDRETGVEEKINAHRQALRHRAFSIFVFNPQRQLLIQKRDSIKYHSAGLWSNTCCGHPRPGEETETAAHRRLKEEMGFDCRLAELFSFIYHVPLEGGIYEHEYDHVFTGIYAGSVRAAPEEVSDYRWEDIPRLRECVRAYPHDYTYWFIRALDTVLTAAAGQKTA